MGISIIRFSTEQDSTPAWGMLAEEKVYRLPWPDEELETLIEALDQRLPTLRESAELTPYSLSELKLWSPLTSRSQLLCQGLNYADHQREAGLKPGNVDPEDNLLFSKSSASLCSASDPIIRPAECQLLDYEAELGLVIKRPIDRPITVPEADLADYVAGFIICNDVSARDQQMGAPAMQWYKGKSYRSFCPAGPILYLLEPGEIRQVNDFNLKLWVNGELRQNANTSQLIHKPHSTLEYLSRFSNLKPGDCLLTGTPGGVALKMTPKTGIALLLNMTRDKRRTQKFRRAQIRCSDYLQDGDLVEIEITSADASIVLGRQANKVIAEPALVGARI